MSAEEEAILIMNGMIASLPPTDAEAVEELADHIRRTIRIAGPTVGSMALGIVGAELQLSGSNWFKLKGTEAIP